MRKGLLFAALFVLALPPGATGMADPGECAPCHPAAGVRWRSGIHAAEGMVCTDCHGGDAAAIDADAGHHRMRRFEASAEILTVCGDCHGEVERMRPYRLTVDQLLLYEASAHGRAHRGGDERAPVCIDCHENHEVLAPADPASPVAAGNLPRTCGACHAGVEPIVAARTDVVAAYSAGMHGRTTGTGPSCALCHDGHGAAVPAGRDVDEVCGGCHEETRARLRSGAHRPLLERNDLAGCASCHPVHAGLTAKPAGVACLDCHEAGSSQAALGIDLERHLAMAEDEVNRAEQALAVAHRIPFDVRDHEALVDDARRYLDAAAAELHGFRREPIEELTRASSSIARRVRQEIDHHVERRFSLTGLFVLWFYAAVTLGVLAHFRRRALARGSP